jgi:hypothetical protein
MAGAATARRGHHVPKRFRRRFEAVDHRELIATYPPPPEYFETHYYMEPERIERLQLTRLQEESARLRRGALL